MIATENVIHVCCYTNQGVKIHRDLVVENGVADDRDVIRPSYIIEHLLAIHQAIKEGIDVRGYVHWTISDNWEWNDGYCPKFGLTSVERDNNLKRRKRSSFHLFKSIATSGKITKQQRDAAWQKVLDAVGTDQNQCRAVDGQSSLDEARKTRILAIDWRFYTGEESCQNFSDGFGNTYRCFSGKKCRKKGNDLKNMLLSYQCVVEK